MQKELINGRANKWIPKQIVEPIKKMYKNTENVLREYFSKEAA